MKETTVNKNISNKTTTTLPHFWRSNITWRSTNTGMNENVLCTYNFYNSKKDIIKHIRENIIPYTDGRRCIPKNERKYNPYFTDVVNDCMKEVWKGKCGFVCNTDQLKEVMRIKCDINVECGELGEFYCWK